MDDAAAGVLLSRLRRFRVRERPDLRIADALSDQLRSARRAGRADAGVAQAWEASVPPSLAPTARIERVTRGVVTVRASHDAAKFGIDRWLRAGGLHTLQRATPAAIKRVRVVV